jgi:hypothetical protein
MNTSAIPTIETFLAKACKKLVNATTKEAADDVLISSSV